MKMIEPHFTVTYSYPVVFTRDALGEQSAVFEGLLGDGEGRRAKVLTVIDSQVLGHAPGLPKKLERFGARYADRAEFILPPLVVPGGERCKNDETWVTRIRAEAERGGLCRHSYVLAIGGGALLDAAGFAAATAHRGIRLIRMPTTTLAMNDAGVGVKNGINAFGRKNFTGSFAPPYAVVNDFDFLRFLPERELRCGIAEAVKVALIRDRDFFDWLHASRHDLARFRPDAMERMIVRCAELHLEQIASGGDPFESGSSRPLDLGHWAAHKLEELTCGEIRHGEAVAIGIALDASYAHRLGLIGEGDLRRILETLGAVGFRLFDEALLRIDVARALGGFREHLGGELLIPLPAGIGGRLERGDLDPDLYRACIETLATIDRRKEQSYGRSVPHHDDGRASRPLFP